MFVRGKTTVAAVTGGVFLLLGAAGVFAASPQGSTGAHHGQRGAKIAAILAKDSGQSVAQVEALKAQDKTWKAVVSALKVDPKTFHQQLGSLGRARGKRGVLVAVLAKASGKTKTEIRAMKTKGVKWSQVESQLGLSQKTVRSQVRARLSGRMRSRAVAGFLAKLSGKTPKELRALKKQDKTWINVAHALGIQ
ncbi:MAG: hypothetical protein M0031_08315 [Thermaerobacter sp.]|nr:hypothetical protein [Thermaerobacter sp.]